MKTRFKVFSVFLAIMMLCAVCVMPVSALDVYSSQYNAPYASEYYYESDVVIGEGLIIWRPEEGTFYYGLTCRNLKSFKERYTLYAQCAVIYSDDTYDFHYINQYWEIQGNQVVGAGETIPFPVDKTIIQLDGEFRIHFEEETLWEGLVYPIYIVGINA